MLGGRLNRRVTIQQQTTTADFLGQTNSTWSTYYTCWAQIDIVSSQLLYSTAEFVSKATHQITMRWTSSVVIQPNMRALYTELVTGVVHRYHIESILNTQQRNRELVLLCYELDGEE